jgi:hypothetical protein
MSIQMLTPEDGDIVGVVVWLEARQAPSFQRAALRWLDALQSTPDGPDGDNQAFAPPFTSDYGPEDAWDLPDWRPQEDLPALKWLLSDLRDGQRRMVEAFVAAGQDGITSEELRVAGGYTSVAGLPGALKAIVGRFRSVGRRPVWDWTDKPTPNGKPYWVKEGPVRSFFRRALSTQ